MAQQRWLEQALAALQPNGGFDAQDGSMAATPTPNSLGAQSPLMALLRGSSLHGQRTGQPDPLASREGASQVVNEGATGLERVAQVTSHGPREGQAHTTFDLGNGLKANVYFDAHGRRKTFVYADGPAPSKA